MKKKIYIFILIFLAVAFSYKPQLNFKPSSMGEQMSIRDLKQAEGGQDTVKLGN